MRMHAVRRLGFTLLLFSLVLACGLFSAPNRLEASTGKLGNEFIFYSDASHTTEVGFEIFCKNGQTFRSGRTSGFVVVVPAGC